MEKQIKEISGVLLINKHAGVTSHDIVNRIRRLYGTQRVGHTGTLDPMATGVLVVLIGRAAKAAEYLVADSKRYCATMRLGLTTDSEDTTGTVLTTTEILPDSNTVIKATESFCGDIMQVPPMYSALKIGGKKLVDIAREGGVIEREARKIRIHSLVCTPTDLPSDYVLNIYCSSGTYIRTLCADIGAKLGVGGVMAALNRIETGGFSIENAYTIDEIDAMGMEERENILIPTEELFKSLPYVQLESFYERLFRGGCEIYQKKIKTSYPIGARVRVLNDRGDFFALGEVKEYPNGSAIKSIKLFEL